MSGSRLRPYLGPVVALLVVLALGAGTVYAAIPNGNGTVYACYVKNTGAVRLINYPKVKTCKAGQKLIKWSARGPAGPVGATGPVGPAGPADWNAIGNKPAGFADGVDNDGVTSVKLTIKNGAGVQVQPGAWVTAIVECPPGSKVTGGGPWTNSRYLHTTDSRPSDSYGSGWKVLAHNVDPGPNPTAHDLFAFAMCMSVEPSDSITVANKGVRPAKLRKHESPIGRCQHRRNAPRGAGLSSSRRMLAALAVGGTTALHDLRLLNPVAAMWRHTR